MLRAASRFVGGAAVAAASAPEPCHARAMQPRPVLPGKRVRHVSVLVYPTLYAQVRRHM